MRWYWRNPTDLSSWYIDETYVKVNGRWSYLYREVDQHGHTIDFYLSSRRNTKSAYAGALSWVKREGKSPDLEHRQVKYKNKVIMAS